MLWHARVYGHASYSYVNVNAHDPVYIHNSFDSSIRSRFSRDFVPRLSAIRLICAHGNLLAWSVSSIVGGEPRTLAVFLGFLLFFLNIIILCGVCGAYLRGGAPRSH